MKKTGREQFNKNAKIIHFIARLLNTFSRKRQEKWFNKLNRGETKIKLLLRYCLLKNLCSSCGNNVYVGEYVTIKHFENLSLGNNVSIHKYSFIDATGKIRIGNDVSIATGCKFFSFNHAYDDLSKPIKYNALKIGEINILDDVWLGCDVVVLCNVTINSRVVVGAKSVVTKSLDGKVLYAGNPAKKIKEIG